MDRLTGDKHTWECLNLGSSIDCPHKSHKTSTEYKSGWNDCRRATLSEVKGIFKQTRQGYKEEHPKAPAYDSITEMYVCDELLKAIEGLE